MAIQPQHTSTRSFTLAFLIPPTVCGALAFLAFGSLCLDCECLLFLVVLGEGGHFIHRF